jgi:glycosyltransferase involved in cell wall biosynthesis
MRITIVQGAFLPVPPLRGGAIEKAFHSLAREFAKNGHKVTYISRQCDGLARQETENSNLKHMRIKGYDASGSLLKLKWKDLLYSIRARRILPIANILITHTFWLPIIATRPKKHGATYVHVGRSPKGQMRFYKNAARLQTVSRPIADAIQKEIPSKKQRQVKVLPYPLDPLFIVRPSLAKPKINRILYAGRIHPEKGINLLIKSFESLPDSIKEKWELNIIGPWKEKHGGAGSVYRKQLQLLAKDMDNVYFQNPIFDQEKLIQEYDRSSIFVYPSLAENGETFGLAALEAMSRGCLTLVSDLPCFKDFINNGVNGFSFNHRIDEPETALAEKLKLIIEVYETENSVSEKAVETATAYSPKRVSLEFIKDFEEIIGISSSRPK